MFNTAFYRPNAVEKVIQHGLVSVLSGVVLDFKHNFK